MLGQIIKRLLLFGVFALVSVSCEGDEPDGFDAEMWRNWECCRDLSRYEMRDAVRSWVDGQEQDDVIARLGPPDLTADEALRWVGCQDCLVYALGLEGGYIRVDPNHLVLTLEDGRVVKSKIL